MRLLIGAFIPRTQWGGETNHRDQRVRKENVRKGSGCCGGNWLVTAANYSGREGEEKQVRNLQMKPV